MRITVDLELCDGHGQCVFAAPAVFELDDVGDLNYAADAGDEQRPNVENAVRLCPVQAIAIIG
jgi:ferredoxin